MAKINNRPSSSRTGQRNIDDMAGAGGGMVLVKIAQALSDANPYKSWLIILAPPLTILIKYLWRFCSSEVVFRVKLLKMNMARASMIREVEKLLADPLISEERKAFLRNKREDARLLTVELLLKRYQDIIDS